MITKGVLAQALGPWKRQAASLSRRVDPASTSWLARLWAAANIIMLVNKLTLGQELFLTTSPLYNGPPEEDPREADV